MSKMKNNEFSKFYNSNVSNSDLQNGGSNHERTKIILRHILSAQNILDLGCNDGSELSKFISDKRKIYGLDISKESIKKAKKNGIKAKVFNFSEETKFPYKDGFFDLVFAGEVIEHIFDTDSFIDNINKTLKSNGKLIITTPNIASLGRRLLLLFGINPYIETSITLPVAGLPPVGHIRYFTCATLRELVESKGFTVESLMSDCVNIGPFRSTFIAKLFPALGWRIILICRKTK